MFGLLRGDMTLLNKEAVKRYKSYYCGICKNLAEIADNKGHFALSFDLTFLNIFLDSYYSGEDKLYKSSCKVNPLKRCTYRENQFSEYAASMNLLLMYYKLLDDIQDDNSYIARLYSKKLYQSFDRARQRYPEQAKHMEEQLKELSEIENREELNFDIPATCFASIMGRVFDVFCNDEKLYQFGFALGKLVYIADACKDLKKDIKKCRYNPMIQTSSQDFQQILTILLDECTEIYDTMNIQKNKDIIDNVLFSGILK